jgi:PAS domain S-box-containing protein
MAKDIIHRLPDYVESFLTKWSAGMDRAGYLKYTTAKREDCIESYQYFLDPLIRQIESHGDSMPFGELLQPNADWIEPFFQVARRHRFRGVTFEMFFGCFKTLVHAMEEIVMEMAAPAREKLDAVNIIRRWGDVLETLLVGDWRAVSQQDALGKLADNNRRLTLEKNKYENIFTATSDIVMVTDAQGAILEANNAADQYLGTGDVLGKFFWEILAIEGRDIAEVLHYYSLYETHEITLFDETAVFNLKIIPLETVSLASKGYMVMLTNVSCLVGQRESLEKTVYERTEALVSTEKQYMSLFQAAGGSILLIDTDFKVIEANQRTGRVFGIRPHILQGRNCDRLCQPDGSITLEQSIRNLDEDEVWEGEMQGRRASGEMFPMAVTINRVETAVRTVFHVLVRDVTQQKKLEQNLRREKSQLEEMNITLRNVMKSIDTESQELQSAVSKKVKDLILPALDKVRKEPSQRVRKGYVDIIEDQLIKLSAASGSDHDAHLLKLTPTEMKICQFVQAGSSTKEIADAMNISVETIQTHRKNIRKKLGLRGRQVNLYTYLNTQSAERSQVSGEV